MRFLAIIVAVFGIVCTKDIHPEQVHIAFGEKQNDIVVTWSTLNETKETLLQFGEGIPMTQVIGNSKVFIDGGPLKLKQWIHRVQLKDLKFNTTYYYKVGSKYGWSKTFSYTTSESEEYLAVNAMIIGDLGQENITSYPYMLADAKHKKYDVLLHLGNLAYDMDSHNGERGNDFMNTMEPLTATIPYMIVPGNHEFPYNYSHVKNRFSMPGFNAFESMYHSFDLGLIHFIGINTEAYYNNHSGYPANIIAEPGQLIAQYNWLKQDLEEANRPENRQKHPWIVGFGHRPFYCSDNKQEHKCQQNEFPHRIGLVEYGGLGLEKLLAESGVDLIMWGHEHSYERFWPVYNKKIWYVDEHPYLNPIYPVQVTTGGAGSRAGADGFVQNTKPWSAYRSSFFGYGRLYCPNRTHIKFEQVFLDTNNDSFWLVKDDHKPYKL